MLPCCRKTIDDTSPEQYAALPSSWSRIWSRIAHYLSPHQTPHQTTPEVPWPAKDHDVQHFCPEKNTTPQQFLLVRCLQTEHATLPQQHKENSTTEQDIKTNEKKKIDTKESYISSIAFPNGWWKTTRRGGNYFRHLHNTTKNHLPKANTFMKKQQIMYPSVNTRNAFHTNKTSQNETIQRYEWNIFIHDRLQQNET